MVLELLTVVVLGLMCGSELNVAAFSHPALKRQPLQAHIYARSALASLLGHVMPFWMAASTLLNFLLLLVGGLGGRAWRFAAIAFAIQVLAVLLSLIGPVPINKRIAQWRPETLPIDWQAQEHRWEVYHWVRTALLIGAFTILTLSMELH
jgi:uncharacterized membrane protein